MIFKSVCGGLLMGFIFGTKTPIDLSKKNQKHETTEDLDLEVAAALLRRFSASEV